MKKIFPEEKESKKGFKEFIDKKGFYVVLLLCMAVAAGAVLFVTSRKNLPGEPDYRVRDTQPGGGDDAAFGDNGEDLVLDPDDAQVMTPPGVDLDDGMPASIIGPGEEVGGIADNSDVPVSSVQTPTAAAAASGPKGASSVKQQSFIMPVEGYISFEYAMDKLVYSKTLEEWRVHPGVDIAADRGTPVKAAADGVVCDIRNDLYLGITVVLDHGDDLKSLYRNLASDEIVAVNQIVKQGEVIGCIGNSAMDECSEPPHLHFEVLKSGANVDPMTYLPKSQASGE